MNVKWKAIVYRFLLFFLVSFMLALVPVLQKVVDGGPEAFRAWGLLWAVFAALIGGFIGAVEKYLAPVLMSVLAAPGTEGQVLPTVGIPLGKIDPTPHENTPTAQAGDTVPTAGGR